LGISGGRPEIPEIISCLVEGSGACDRPSTRKTHRLSL